MPIYEYSCRACHAAFEKLIVRSGDLDDIGCPNCRSRDVERILSRTADTRDKSGGSQPPPRRPCGPVG